MESVNSTFDAKEQQWEKFKKRICTGYGAIINPFGIVNPYKKNSAQKKKFMEDLLLFIVKI